MAEAKIGLYIGFNNNPFLAVTDVTAEGIKLINCATGTTEIVGNTEFTELFINNSLNPVPEDYYEGEFYSSAAGVFTVISVSDQGDTIIKVGDQIRQTTDWSAWIGAVSLKHGIPYETWWTFESLTASLTEEYDSIIDEGIEKGSVPENITERLVHETYRIGYFLWINKIQVDSVMGAVYVSRDENDEFWLTRSNDGIRTFNLKEFAKDWEMSTRKTIEYMTVGVEEEYAEAQKLFRDYYYGY